MFNFKNFGIMKKNLILGAIAGIAMISACGTQKQAATSSQQTSGSSPFGEVYEVPCAVYDTPEQFAATGIYRGSSYQKGEVQLNALQNARQLVYEKFHHAYQGMVSNYSQSVGNNRGNDITTKMNRAGDQILDIILNDVQATCVKFSNVGDDGMVECYVGIVVPKSVIAEQVSNAVADVLTPEEKEAIAFDEYVYRKQMQERMSEYKEQKK